MRYRSFGATGLRVAEVFLGAMTFGEQGGVGAPPEECRRMRPRALADSNDNRNWNERAHREPQDRRFVRKVLDDFTQVKAVGVEGRWSRARQETEIGRHRRDRDQACHRQDQE